MNFRYSIQRYTWRLEARLQAHTCTMYKYKLGKGGNKQNECNNNSIRERVGEREREMPILQTEETTFDIEKGRR